MGAICSSCNDDDGNESTDVEFVRLRYRTESLDYNVVNNHLPIHMALQSVLMTEDQIIPLLSSNDVKTKDSKGETSNPTVICDKTSG